ncbi:hypothetical protein CEN48_01075 [Fischerella thermalis CCMEE 5282]|uniref:Tn3 family transposase n=1 Tax=Fischerella thermalis TaxID=372787 RepID=UPI000C7FE582|nr:hypothetical protein CEN48_01075 [Fischerella thermalis CCMEE 5282]
MRRRATTELNKGKLKHSLSRAMFFHRLGEVCDRSFEEQCLRASGLNKRDCSFPFWHDDPNFCPRCWTPETAADPLWSQVRAKFCYLCGMQLQTSCTHCRELVVSLKWTAL